MIRKHILGIDPGPVCGITRIIVESVEPARAEIVGVDVMQTTPGLLVPVLDSLWDRCPDRLVVAVERYVIGRRSSRVNDPGASATTRNMVGDIGGWAARRHATLMQRSAADVKVWATDTRLDRVGLLDLTKGMRHARDAGRHALFCACRDFGVRDPLSRRGSGSEQ